MGQDEEERWVKIGWFLLIKIYLFLDIISRIIESIDFIPPEGFLVEGVESQGEANEETEKEDQEFSLF